MTRKCWTFVQQTVSIAFVSKDVSIGLRLDDDDQAALEALAREGETKSDTVRRLIREAAALQLAHAAETPQQALTRISALAESIIAEVRQRQAASSAKKPRGAK